MVLDTHITCSSFLSLYLSFTFKESNFNSLFLLIFLSYRCSYIALLALDTFTCSVFVLNLLFFQPVHNTLFKTLKFLH